MSLLLAVGVDAYLPPLSAVGPPAWWQSCRSNMFHGLRASTDEQRVRSRQAFLMSASMFSGGQDDDADEERLALGGAADLNWLHTKLALALDREDYAEAASVRDRIRQCTDLSGMGVAGEAAWENLGVPDWLSDRLERLNFALPTRVQLHALRAAETGDDAAICAPTGSGKTLSYLLPLLSQLSDDLLSEDLSNYLASFLDGGRPRRSAANKRGAERRRAASSNVGDGVGDTAVPTPAVLVIVPTRELGVQVSMLCYRLLGGGTSNPTLQPYADLSRYQFGAKANMFSYKGPRHVKIAGLWDENALMEAYQELLKGVHVVVGTPEYLSRVALDGDMLRLQNVRGIVVDEADACLGDKGSREAMSSLLRRMMHAREASGVTIPPQTILAGASLTPELVRSAAESGWVRSPTLVSEFGWIEAGLSLEALSGDGNGGGGANGGGAGGSYGREREGDFEGALRAIGRMGADGAAAWNSQRVPAGSSHEYIVSEPREAVATLCRMLRERFERHEAETTKRSEEGKAEEGKAEAEAEASAEGKAEDVTDVVEAERGAEEAEEAEAAPIYEMEAQASDASESPPPRVVVFAPSAEAAVELADRLQGALFGTLSGDASAGLWGLSVLLPSAEARLDAREGEDGTLNVLESSLRVMEMFACDRTSVLVTTAAATRGLDFPQVTDVFNLGIVGSPADYVHRAGRVGRVGQSERGSVVSVLCPSEVSDLLELGRTLKFTPKQREPPRPSEPLSEKMTQEDQVQALSDIFNLLESDLDADK